jgi:hypothetical protein
MEATAKNFKPSIPDVVPLVLEYFAQPGNEGGGIFHVVLVDKNYEKCHAVSALEVAQESGDSLALKIAEMLVEMSSTQRRKLSASLHWYSMTDEQKARRRQRDDISPGL